MVKPSGYDEAKATNGFEPVELGGHYAIIKQVSERDSSTGKPMVVVLFDFCKPDKQDGYFQKQYENDDRDKDQKKWPHAATKYVMVNDYQDSSKTSRDFKTFCSCAEKSNNFTISWGGNNWAQQFKGKKIGVVFGEEENEYNGKVTMRPAVRWFCNWDSVEKASVPKPKYLKNKPADSSAPAQSDSGWMNVPANVEEEIPF